MANTLGSLFVELGINTAAFVEGVSKATYQAKAGALQIGSAFSSIGGKLSEVGAQFGQFGGIVGAAIGTIGQNISGLSREFGSLSGSVGAMKLGAIGILAVGAAAVTAGGALIAVAVHASEAAARVYQLSQSTGVSVKDLSGLGVVGQLVGLNMDTLAKGLERMDRSALMAAKSPNAASNAYRQLGISVLDTSGHLKPTVELFGEVADKFSVMEDSATKTALAMQIFGRAGAELIPILNKGSEALKYWMDYGTQVGAVLDTKAAAGAEAFHNELTKLDLISTGVQNKLMVALLPALDHIVASFTEFVSHGNAIADMGNFVGKALVFMAERVYDAVEAWDWWSAHIDIWHAKLEAFARQHNIFANVVLGYKPKPESEGGMSDADLSKFAKDAQDNLQKQLDHLAVSRADLESKVIIAPGPEGPKRTGAPPATTQPEAAVKPEKDIVGDLIAKTELATAAEVARTTAIGQSTAALLLEKATEQALQTLGSTRLQITDRLKALAQEEAAAAAAGSTKKIGAIKAQEDALRAQLVTLDASKQKLVALFDTKEVATFAATMSGALEKQNEQMKQQIALAQAMASARFQGGQTEVDAGIEEKLAKDKASLMELKDAYAALAQVQGVDATQLATLSNAIAQVSSQIDRHRAMLQQDHDVTVATAAAKLSLAAASRNEALSFMETEKALKANITDSNDLASAMLLLKSQQQSAAAALTTQWDNAALAVGSYREKFTAVMNELALEGQSTGKNIAAAFKTMLDGISSQFAAMVATGKFNFVQLFQTLEESIIKALASQALNSLMSKLTSLGGGSSGNAGGGGIAGFFGAILGAFGGGKAGGGPVSPGMSYVVGENGPEILQMGNAAGSIVPNSGNVAGSPMQTPNVNVHVHGASDPDTFRKAAPQIAAAMFQSMRAAYSRNGGQ